MTENEIERLRHLARRLAAAQADADETRIRALLREVESRRELDDLIWLLTLRRAGLSERRQRLATAIIAAHLSQASGRQAPPAVYERTPDAAVEWFRRRGAMDDVAGWRRLDSSARQYAFAVAGIENLSTVNLLKKNIVAALEAGTAPSVAAAAQAAAGAEWKEFAALSRARRELIYRNAVFSAAAAGRWARIKRNAKFNPYLYYSAILDARLRPAHRRLHGIVLPVNHRLWRDIYPPNGHNCRCTVLQLNDDDLRRRKLRITPPSALRRINPAARVDAGWSGRAGDNWRGLGAQTVYKSLDAQYSADLQAAAAWRKDEKKMTPAARQARARRQARDEARARARARIGARHRAGNLRASTRRWWRENVDATSRLTRHDALGDDTGLMLPPLTPQASKATSVVFPRISRNSLKRMMRRHAERKHGVPSADALNGRARTETAKTFSRLPNVIRRGGRAVDGGWEWDWPDTGGKLRLKIQRGRQQWELR